MKRFATFAMLALMSGAVMSQPTATPATGTPAGSDKAPGTAASDVAPSRPGPACQYAAHWKGTASRRRRRAAGRPFASFVWCGP